ncbi:chaplin [Streptomyces sp. NPDC029526]|uniref:chaplin n=1 Tax=Streptomyces sp. NPDC029526 TaxID=3155728 RepID=UPI003406A6A6
MGRITRSGMIVLAAASGALAVAGPAHADAGAEGSATGSAGLVSGNTVELPVDLPVNACGNTADVVGLLNPALGNTCAEEDTEDPAPPPSAVPPHPLPAPVPAPHTERTELAETGSEGTAALAGAGAALFLGGAALYRRSRPRPQR